MRLLVLDDHDQFSLTKDLVSHIPPYAVLSHTWADEEEEVTFADLARDSGRAKIATRGYRKIQFCGKQAARDGLRHFWVDTCCIDKSSSAELSEAITCMFRWYRDAAKCYVHLEDVSAAGRDSMKESPWEPAFRKSRWFTRGWTLQELIAPQTVDFFSSDGRHLGNKKSLEHLLHEVTGINVEALQGRDLSEFNIEERFSWAANRETKREEDRAYALLGLFNVYMLAHYGEGASNAFRRLEAKIYKHARTISPNARPAIAFLDQRGSNIDEPMAALSRVVTIDDSGRLPLNISAALSSPGESGFSPSHGKVDQAMRLRSYPTQFGTSFMDFPRADLYTQGRFQSVNPQHKIRWRMDDAQRRTNKAQDMAAIIDWLDMTNFNRQYNAHQQYEKQLSLHLDGTCNWITRNPEYIAWESDDSGDEASRLLWVCGPAGHGKSVLCAKLVKHFKDKQECPVAFFFSSPHASSASASDLSVIIRAWMTQMASDKLDVLELLLSFSKRSDIGSRALESEIWSAFESILAQKRGVALFLDGYDEYPRTDSTRINFLQRLKSAAAGTATRIFITSREESDIKAELSPGRSQISEQVIFKCRITSDDVNDDLRLYSRSVVDKSLPNKDGNLKEKLAGQLIRKCEGMFLWIKLQQLQQSRGKNGKQLERIVEEMPSGLNETYGKNWAAIKRRSAEDQDRAFAILRWTTFAFRPLTVSEISEALVVDARAKASSLPMDELPDDVCDDYIEGEIIDLCGTLVEAREGKEHDKPGSRTIHLVHPSVRNFVLSTLPVHQETLSDVPVIEEHAASPADHHRYLATTCLAYLSYDNIWNDSEANQSGGAGRPFLDYAARFWHLHLDNGTKDDLWTSQMVNDFFHTRNSSFGRWAAYFESCDEANDNETPTIGTLMYYATLFDLNAVMESIWIEDKTQINALGGRYGTPLQAACAKHNEKAFEMLMKWGAETNVEGGEFGTALIAAAARGYEDMVRALTRNGAKLETTNEDGDTAINSAAVAGHLEVVRLLLDGGVNANAQTRIGWTPINVAAWYGYLEMVRLLLDHGVNARIPEEQGTISIASAVKCGHSEIVRLLLDRGEDVNALNGEGWPLIYLAAYDGRVEIVRLLLSRGADAKAPANDGWTAFHVAALNGDLQIVRLLLDYGENVNARNGEGTTAIYLAAESGRLEVAQLLLDRGADANASESNGWTPINAAANSGHLEVVRILLDHGVDCNILSSDGWVPISAAANSGFLEIVRILLDRGADCNLPCDAGWTPIIVATSCGSLEIVQLLLDRGANATLVTNEGWAPITFAADRGHTQIVRLLLDQGMDANTLNYDGWSPIHLAAGNGHFEVVQLLLDCGATAPSKGQQTPFHTAALSGSTKFLDLLLSHHRLNDHSENANRGSPINTANETGFDVNAICHPHGTALHCAANGGHLTMLQVLVDIHGADITARDEMGRTALHLAAYGGHLTMLQALVDIHGADITARDGMGRTALHLAARGGDALCVRYLLDKGLNCSDEDRNGDTVLYYACFSGSTEVTREVLTVDPIKIPETEKWSPLHWACRTGDFGLVELLIEKGGYETLIHTTSPLEAWNLHSVARYHQNPNLKSGMEESLITAFRASPSCSTSASATNSLTGDRHGSFRCDCCFHDIYGPRFHCNVCYDVNFCFMCNLAAERMHPDHDLQMIEPGEKTT